MSKCQFDTVIAGLGITGLSCARFLAKQGIRFAITDSRNHPPMLDTVRKLYPEIPVYTGGLRRELLLDTENILISPGISIQEPEIQSAVAAGVHVYGDVELFSQYVNAPVLAITGSNGKSTVTTLVSEVTRTAGMKTAVGGNLGTPVLDLLSEEDIEVYIVELSSFQLETVFSLKTLASVVLNISEDHMDRYPNFENYCMAKSRIYQNARVTVINRDDANVCKMMQAGRHNVTFGIGEPENDDYGMRHYGQENWLVRGKDKLMPAQDLGIPGTHNIYNALAVYSLCDVLQVPAGITSKVLRKFTGLPHRCQLISEENGIRWINDSKGTNVGATSAAISGLSENRNIILIAGGDGKGADFSRLANDAEKFLKHVVLIGKDAKKIHEAIEGCTEVTLGADMKDAVIKAANVAEAGDIVLLSPACASQDMFTDYKDRGETFVFSVNEYLGHHG